MPAVRRYGKSDYAAAAVHIELKASASPASHRSTSSVGTFGSSRCGIPRRTSTSTGSAPGRIWVSCLATGPRARGVGLERLDELGVRVEPGPGLAGPAQPAHERGLGRPGAADIPAEGEEGGIRRGAESSGHGMILPGGKPFSYIHSNR